MGRRDCGHRLCLSDSSGRRAFTGVFLVGLDPVGNCLALSGLEVQLAGEYEPVELPKSATDATLIERIGMPFAHDEHNEESD
jgi:hypothetical protein